MHPILSSPLHLPPLHFCLHPMQWRQRMWAEFSPRLAMRVRNMGWLSLFSENMMNLWTGNNRLREQWLADRKTSLKSD